MWRHLREVEKQQMEAEERPCYIIIGDEDSMLHSNLQVLWSINISVCYTHNLNSLHKSVKGFKMLFYILYFYNKGNFKWNTNTCKGNFYTKIDLKILFCKTLFILG